MSNYTAQDNAIAAIRISSIKQGLQGDSPEDQKQQIERFAKARGIKIKKFFIFMESASKEEQPVQEAIDYCKKQKNDIQLFIIKSIDRFTRGGSYLYDHLKMQLENIDVRLVDIYGIIGSKNVNTLDHLNVKYKWSVYNPTKKAEILEAERAKDEMRDIMTRMIGAEIRYVRMGYRVRRAPFGYQNKKVETQHGKRVILEPHPKEAGWVKKMYALRIQCTLNDNEIVSKLNKLGFKSRQIRKRDRNNRMKIIGTRGEKPLTVKALHLYLQNPVYAGFNIEKWTDRRIINGKYDGLVSINDFNLANQGKISIVHRDGEYVLEKRTIQDKFKVKRIHNPDFPYKKFITCPICNKPLNASASRGGTGKLYPAYHCRRSGHNFRIPLKEFNKTVEDFIENIEFTPNYIDKLRTFMLKAWENKLEAEKSNVDKINEQIADLEKNIPGIIQKLKMLNSPTAIKYLEEDLEKTEVRIKQLENSKKDINKSKLNMNKVMDHVDFYLRNFKKLLMEGDNPLKRAEYFSLIFEKRPTYENIVLRTANLSPFIRLKDSLYSSYQTLGAPSKI